MAIMVLRLQMWIGSRSRGRRRAPHTLPMAKALLPRLLILLLLLSMGRALPRSRGCGGLRPRPAWLRQRRVRRSSRAAARRPGL